MKKFWIIISVCWLWTCGGGGGGSSPTEPQEPAPVSNFTATPTTLIQGQAVTFTSTSTGTITSYAWNVDNDPAIEGTTATYSHTYTEVGTYSVTLTVTGPGGSNPKTVADMITVSTAAPTPTTATSQTVQEDGSTTISLTATDPNGQAVTFAITTDPTNGTATLSDSDITYTPNANFYGTDSFDYTASNGTYTSDPVTITITVEGEDDGDPTTNDVSATTDEDTVVTVNLDATEIDGDNYSFSIVSQPTNGTLGSVNGNQVEYTPNQDFNGTDTFTFEATDDRTSRRNVATATITVNAINDAPVANDVTASMNENKIVGRYQPVTITLDATDVDGDALTYFKQSDPSNGTLGTITNNQVVYTPTQDFNGEDTFIYKATDGNADSNGATVTITVAAVNDAPVTTDQSASTDEDTAVDVTLTATDVENDNLTFTIVSDASNGTTSLSGTTVTYTPTANYNGTDTFTFTANDGTDDSNTSTVTITVASVNDAPVANDVTASMDENKIAGRYQPVTITLDATDVEGDNLTYSVIGDVSSGTLGSVSTNQIIYTPTQDFNGTDTFTYKANDGTDDSNKATVTITVAAVNDAPVTTDQSASTDEDTAVDVTLTATDVENDNLTFTIVSDASNGTTSLSGTTVTYTPTANYNGTDTFTFTANDGTDDSNTSTVTITVVAVDDIPVVDAQTLNTNEDTAVSVTLTATDVEGDTIEFAIDTAPSNGTLNPNTASWFDGQFDYTPNQDFNGTDTILVKAKANGNQSVSVNITINIAAVNDAPTTSAVSASTNEDTSTTITLSGTDVEGDTITYSIVSDASNGTTSLSGATVTYTPTANYNGTDTFTFKANDGTVDSNTSTVTITVASVNDAPVANDVSSTIDENRFARMATLTLDATDVEGDALTYSLVSDPSNGTVSVSGSTLTYNANQDWNGTETFTYKASDGTDDSNTATITITVNAINDTPVVVGSDEKNSKSIDFDGGSSSYLGVTGSPGINENVGVFTTAMTVHAWVKADKLENNKYIISKGNAKSSGQRAYSLRSPNATGSNANKWEAALTTEYTTDGGGLNSIEYQLYSTSDASLTEWTHLAMTFDGSDIKFYINGSLETTQSVTGNDINNPQIHPNAADEDFRIGDLANATPSNYNFDGKIDAPAIWNTALSSSQISNLYNSGNGLSPTEVATSNLQGYWNFEDNLNDLTSNNNNLGASGGLSYVSDVPGQYNTPVTASTNEDTAVDISLVGTDVDGDNLSYSIVTNPSNGAVSISGSTATYTPSSNYNGNDSFVYKANDGTVDSANRTVFIEIAAVNDTPTTSAVSASTNEDTAKAITLVGADVDTGDTLTYSIVSNVSNGSLGSVSGSSVTYTPTANWNGTDTFTFKANDGTSDSNTSTVTITVAAVNDAPIANNMSLSLDRGSSIDFTLDATDEDGDSLSKTIVSQPENGSLIPGTGLKYTYTPDSGYFGTDSLTYKVNDGFSDSEVKMVSLTINELIRTFGNSLVHLYLVRSDNNTNYLISRNSSEFVVIEFDDSLELVDTINKGSDAMITTITGGNFQSYFTDFKKINSGYVFTTLGEAVVYDSNLDVSIDLNTSGSFGAMNVYDLEKLSNGNYMVTGAIKTANSGNPSAVYRIIDSSNNIVSTTITDTWTDGEWSEHNDFLELSDGNYFISYYDQCSWSNSSDKATSSKFIKMDSSGNLIWTLDHGYCEPTSDIIEVNNKIIIGFADDDGDHIKALDLNGNLLWTDSYGNSEREMQLLKHSSGDIIVSGSSGDNPRVPFLARITDSGSVVWQKNYEGISSSNYHYNIRPVETSDGNLIVLYRDRSEFSESWGVYKVDASNGTKLLP